MHTPSEHTIDGKALDFELHIVHKCVEGCTGTKTEYGVLGFLFDREKGGNGENLFLNQIPTVGYTSSWTGRDVQNNKISLKGFLDSVDFSRFWSYHGSLTTPPCS